MLVKHRQSSVQLEFEEFQFLIVNFNVEVLIINAAPNP
jgi:hypothetical protein